jgi:hypothetical protein
MHDEYEADVGGNTDETILEMARDADAFVTLYNHEHEDSTHEKLRLIDLSKFAAHDFYDIISAIKLSPYEGNLEIKDIDGYIDLDGSIHLDDTEDVTQEGM